MQDLHLEVNDQKTAYDGKALSRTPLYNDTSYMARYIQQPLRVSRPPFSILEKVRYSHLTAESIVTHTTHQTASKA